MTTPKYLFPAGFEPATLRVWGARDNHYTTETRMIWLAILMEYKHHADDGSLILGITTLLLQNSFIA